MNVAMGIVVMLPLFFVGSFLLGQGIPQPQPRRALIAGIVILGALFVGEIIWIGWHLVQPGGTPG